MDIVLVSHSADLQGAERCLLETTEVLLERGHSVCVVTPRSGTLNRRLKEIGARVFVHSCVWWAYTEFQPPAARRMVRSAVAIPSALLLAARLAVCRRPDAIMTNTLATPVGALCAAVLGVRHVWFVHELVSCWSFDLDAVALKLMRRLTSHFLVNSRATGEELERALGGVRSEVVYQPVTVSSSAVRARQGRSACHIIVVGRVEAAKRQEDAVDALVRLIGLGVDASLDLVGRVEERYGTMLRERAAKFGVSGKITFRGEVPEATPIMREAAVLVSCCSREGLGRSVVEAMLIGVPVVAADGAAIRELIDDGVTGWTYPPGESRALAHAVIAATAQTDVVSRVVRTAQNFARSRFVRDDFAQTVVTALRGKALQASRVGVC